MGVCTERKCIELCIYDVSTSMNLVFQYKIFVSRFFFLKCELFTYPQNLTVCLFAAVDKMSSFAFCSFTMEKGEPNSQNQGKSKHSLLRVLLNFLGHGPTEDLIQL